VSSISDMPAGMANLGLPESRAEQLLGSVARSKPADSKLQKSAQQFEAILIAKWLEDAEASFAKLPGEDKDPDADPGQDQFRSMSQQFLAENISAAGGLGIAAMIVKNLQQHNQQSIDNKKVNDIGAGTPAAASPGASTNDY